MVVLMIQLGCVVLFEVLSMLGFVKVLAMVLFSRLLWVTTCYVIKWGARRLYTMRSNIGYYMCVPLMSGQKC